MTVNVINGSVNGLSLVVPGVYIGIVPPPATSFQPVAANVFAGVGTASYGPRNTPVAVVDMPSYSAAFGPVMPRAGDLGTAVAICVQQGCDDGFCVRVTDGTDTAAFRQAGVSGSNYAVLFSARYTGSAGNGFSYQYSASAFPNALKVTLYNGLGAPEVFDNITTASAPAFWAALVNAINNGTATPARPRSQYFSATLGTNTTATTPTANPNQYPLSGGTDGALFAVENTTVATTQGSASATVSVTSGTGITIGQAVYGTSIATGTIVAGISGTTVTLSLVPSAPLVSGAALQFGMTMAQAFVGVDGAAGIRSGMYALRGSGATHATLCDLYDSFTFTAGASPALTGGTIDTWAAQAAFAFSERIYMVGAAAPGDMPGNWAGYNAPGIVGAQNWSFKAMFGDWCYWSDVTNNMVRMVSPATFAMARLAAQSPVLSALNQPIFGISGSQFANSNLVWTQADIAIVQAAGFDVIVPPGQGAGGLNIWSCATGNNAAPNGAVQGDNYTTMTNYVISSLAQAGAIGPYIGDAITASLNQVIYGELANFGQSLEDAGLIGNAQGTTAFTVTNTSTPTQNQNGIDVFAMQIQYLAILREFAINVQGGQTVTIQDQATGQYLFQ